MTFIPPGATTSATRAVDVTPSDTDDLAGISRAIWVGTAGNLAVVMRDGTTVTIVGVVAGSMLPIQVSRVNNTNTTASDIIAFY